MGVRLGAADPFSSCCNTVWTPETFPRRFTFEPADAQLQLRRLIPWLLYVVYVFAAPSCGMTSRGLLPRLEQLAGRQLIASSSAVVLKSNTFVSSGSRGIVVGVWLGGSLSHATDQQEGSPMSGSRATRQPHARFAATLFIDKPRREIFGYSDSIQQPNHCAALSSFEHPRPDLKPLDLLISAHICKGHSSSHQPCPLTREIQPTNYPCGVSYGSELSTYPDRNLIPIKQSKYVTIVPTRH